MMKSILTILTILTFMFNSYSQIGYLGNLNGLEVNTKLVPSFEKSADVDNNTNKHLVHPTVLTLAYGIKYSRVIKRKSLLSFGYSYSQLKAVSHKTIYQESSIDNGVTLNEYYDVLKDPKFDFHQFDIEYKVYHRGNISPTGKFIGIGYRFGKTTQDSNPELMIGQLGIQSVNSKFSSSFEILNHKYVPYKYSSSIVSQQLYCIVGRSYPISPSAIVNFEFDIPLLLIVITDEYLTYGFRLNGRTTYENEHSKLSNMHAYSIKLHNSFALKVGLKYCF